MFRPKIFLTAILFFFFSYIAADSLKFFRDYEWLDIPFHLFGGFVVAFFFAIMFEGDLKKRSKLFSLVFLIGVSSLVGILWEFFEWGLDNWIYYGFARQQQTINDTMGDLLNDIFGGLTLSLLFIKRKLR